MRMHSIEHREGALIGVLIAAGLLALTLRVFVIGMPGAAFLFVAILASLAVISTAAPMGRTGTPVVPVPWVFALGVAAVFAATLVVGRGVSLPHSGFALLLGAGAAVSEELFFRRLVYGGLARVHPAVAIIGSALLFALVHIPLYGVPVFWVDLGAGLLFSWQRWASGGWTASAGTHVVANLLAVIR